MLVFFIQKITYMYIVFLHYIEDYFKIQLELFFLSSETDRVLLKPLFNRE